ncbi:MAG: D-arabinose 5-phosphate isomerase [Nitrospirae bacterium GWF2_44_13]|nr:MAG: D-arabinose 5-phosphate isomerase [Nitrospirae bacterium GWF2_44_13]OGW33511.1 MAG: D-arabinose 5-phosphate isomerase [Nitrospirae bacterium GWD2_44_7]OGW64697.1 MAG: D-arabinose 5-phosphate isomerase [Nitrospirae bacterium RIFOXYA2_FULL_44_9]HBG92107.1 D-arabinose 5-phosphate isomerase [Nitrospiraceae bacterium]
MENIIDIAKKVLRIEAEAVAALAEKLDSTFEKTIDIIFKSKGRVVVTGMGKSGLVGKKIAATLASTGTPAFFMHPAEASHGDLGMVTSDDVIIAISNSGETEELSGLIPFLKRFNVGLIAMTGSRNSTLAKSADVHLDVSVKEEACPLGVVPTASTTAALAMGDAVAVALMVKRGLKQEDFAFFHPGGNLGKKLFIKVKDLMHTGDALPFVSPQTEMTKAVVEISSKRLGVAIVSDKDKKILGVLTDGDIRRGIEKWGKDFFDMKAGEVMTKNPKTISEDELAVKALSIMETHSITSLAVPDSDGKAIGIIHLHDVLKQGLA